MKHLYLLIAFIWTFSVKAAPWINPDDIYLRADIQVLADKGIIKAPINHWPLMWADVAPDLIEMNQSQLTRDVQDSYARVMFHYRQAKSNKKSTKITAQVATDSPTFRHFGSTNSEKAQLNVENEYVGNVFAGKLQVNHLSDADDDKNFRLDGSYMAFKLENWSLSAGYTPMWWGPGWDSALLLSTNARPIPGITLSRVSADAFESQWLSWIGPWTFTTFMGQLEESGRTIGKPLFWASKISIKPFKQLELSASRSTQWGGNGRGSGFSDFWEIVIPSESDNKVNNSTDVNDLGSIDLRWNSDFFSQPFGLYYEMAFEDYGISTLAPSKRSHLFGVDSDINTHLGLFSVFAEFSDTYHQECACIYEHDIYRSGYTHRGKVIGSTYGKNAQSFTFGVMGQLKSDRQWQINIAKIELNKDNENLVTEDNIEQYQDIMEVRGKYRFILANSRWEISALLRKTDVNSGNEIDNDAQLSLSWEYKL